MIAPFVGAEESPPTWEKPSGGQRRLWAQRSLPRRRHARGVDLPLFLLRHRHESLGMRVALYPCMGISQVSIATRLAEAHPTESVSPALPPIDALTGPAPPHRRTRWLKRLAILAGLAAGVVGLRFTLLAPEPVPVTVFRAAAGHVEETVTNSKTGTIKSRRRAQMSPEIAGRVRAIPVRAGTRVKRGDVLVQLADQDLRAQLTLQRRSLDAARATERQTCAAAQQTGRDLTRIRALTEARVTSTAEFDRAQSTDVASAAACDAAHAHVEQTRASIEAAQVALAHTVLRAPFDAIVADVNTEVGEYITPAPPGVPIPPVVDLFDSSSIYVSAPLDEVDVKKISLGLPVRVTMDAAPGRSFEGRLTRIAPYISDRLEQGRTFEVEVELVDAGVRASLVPGTSTDVEVILRAHEQALRVPTYALIRDRAVMVVRSHQLVEVPVNVGLRNWDFVEITSGLSPGDLVVVSLDRIDAKAGANVRVESEVQR